MANEMPKETVNIKFDGPALEDRSIPIEDVIPTLHALAEILKLVNRELNGEKVPITSSITIPEKQNSFEFDVVLNHTLVQQFAILFNAEIYKTARDIVKFIFHTTSSTVSLVNLVKLFSRKDNNDVEIELNLDKAKFTWQDGTSVETSGVAAKVATSKSGMKQLKKLVQVLMKDGYDKIEFAQNKTQLDGFNKEDGIAIQKINEETIRQTVVTRSQMVIVKIRKPDLLSKTQWEVVYNKAHMNVKMEDDDWLADFLAARVVLPAGCSLRVDIRHEIPLDANGVRLLKEQRNFIEKVHEVLQTDDKRESLFT